MQIPNSKDLSHAGRWYRNRDEWLRHVLTRDYLTANEKLVGQFIALHMNRHDSHTKHQQTTIAKDLGITTRTVKRAVKKLEEEGLIGTEKRRRGVRKRAVNLHYLIFPWEVVRDPSR